MQEKMTVFGKVVGYYDPITSTFSKRVSKAKHFMWKLHAWGIDLGVVNQLKERGCKMISIHDKDSNNDLHVSFNTFLDKHFVKSFGHGPQVFIHESWVGSKEDDSQVEMNIP